MIWTALGSGHRTGRHRRARRGRGVRWAVGLLLLALTLPLAPLSVAGGASVPFGVTITIRQAVRVVLATGATGASELTLSVHGTVPSLFTSLGTVVARPDGAAPAADNTKPGPLLRVGADSNLLDGRPLELLGREMRWLVHPPETTGQGTRDVQLTVLYE